MKILITGAAGFIGMHAVSKFASLGHEVTGLDNINSYYETDLKYARLKQLGINRDDLEYNKKVRGNQNILFVLLVVFSLKKFSFISLVVETFNHKQ